MPWGMAGGYTDAQLTDLGSKGIRIGLLEMEWGPDVKLRDPKSIVCFADHLNFIQRSMPAERPTQAIAKSTRPESTEDIGRIKRGK